MKSHSRRWAPLYPVMLASMFLVCCFVTAFARPGLPQSYSSTPSPAPGVPFDRFSDSFRKNHGLEASMTSLEKAFEQGYVVVRLGLFDVWYPCYALREKKKAESFKTVAKAILDLQKTWIDWVAESEMKKAASRDMAALQKWVRSWNLRMVKPGTILGQERPDLLLLLKAHEKVRLASKRIGDLMAEGRALGIPLKRQETLFLVLSPTREDFLQLGSFLGSLNVTNRQILWRNNLAMWTSFIRDGIHVLAMEHPSTWPGKGDITRGIDMNAREKSGLLQHIVQHLTGYLLEYYHGDDLPGDLLKGLGQNMVIDLYKENNVRAGGGRKGRKTASYSMFVAGGNSSGGRLAARNADNHWRHSKGRDYFLTALRAAQKEGARIALKASGKKRDKRAFFALQPDDGGGEAHLVGAPFLAEERNQLKDVPENFQDEALEFARAYRSAFAFWLKTRAKSRTGSSESEELLRRLLRASGAPPEGESRAPCDKRLQEIYGCSLTDRDGTSESLEWQFLDWLSRRR